MPYKCVHCSSLYGDDAPNLIQGCSQCKSKFFFYIKEEKLQSLLEETKQITELNEKEKDQIEKDVREIAGIMEEETPIFLDLESVRVIKPGKYLIDLTKLFAMHKPRVYQLEDGKYIVDLGGGTLPEKN